jgi:hypothetical protein
MTAAATPSHKPQVTIRKRMPSGLRVGEPVGDQGSDLIPLVFL